MKVILLFSFLLLSFSVQAQLKNESEAGLAAANGNTKSQTYNLKHFNSYTFDKNLLSLRARYLNAKANGVETARIFSVGLRYERELTEKVSLFVGETYEFDLFAGIKHRYISDAGGKYSYIKSEKTKLFSELGYRFMQEDRFDGSQTSSHYARFYNEWEHKWNDNFSSRYWLEYLPNFSEPKDYQLNTEASISAMLSEIFSLKTGMLLRYDHAPAPGVLYKTDTLFTTALVAKF